MTLPFNWPIFVSITIAAIVLHTALILVTRLVGLRSFSKMSGFDFAVTVAIGSILASTLVCKKPPLFEGLTALIILFSLQYLLATLRKGSTQFRNLVDNQPRLIMMGDRRLPQQMAHARITKEDLKPKLREANVRQLDEVHAVIAETTGDISVLHSNDGDKSVDPLILSGVRGFPVSDQPTEPLT